LAFLSSASARLRSVMSIPTPPRRRFPEASMGNLKISQSRTVPSGRGISSISSLALPLDRTARSCS
jgi:hypothetical protein